MRPNGRGLRGISIATSPRQLFMTKVTPDGRCESCGSLLVPPSLAIGFRIPAEADYVCMKCGRPYRWSGTPPRLITIPRQK
jgi:DNA-directed RNA polymerase subunit RPC12/RpoP